MNKKLSLLLALVFLIGMMPLHVLSLEWVDEASNVYRWQMTGNELVSMGQNGFTQNSMTLVSGAVQNGVLTRAKYTLETPIVLEHDRPWSIEWSGKGNWSGMLLASTLESPSDGLNYLFRDTGTKIFAFGEYNGSWHNYGMVLDFDVTAAHIFRLENRIDADGSNAVYLVIDGQEMGAMTRHYISANDQNEHVNWAKGKDIVFSNMGTATHPVSGLQLDYLQIVEGEHGHAYTPAVTFPDNTQPGYTVYTCTVCGDSYRTSWLDENAYEGKTIACVGDSITAAYGVTKDENDYVTLLAQRLGMNYIRLGDSGTTLCTDGSRTCNIRRLTESYLRGADVVTIAMGINDFCAAGADYYELGDIDSTDTSTIYGAARMWCERIAELRKTESLSHTQFYFLTPVICSWNSSVTSQRNWDQSKTNIHGYTLRDLCNAIMEVAALYDVAVIDMNLVSGMYHVDGVDNNTAVFGGDGVHPGPTGHQMMAEALANGLLQNDRREDHSHTFGSWITTTWPTCSSGEQKRVCTVCSATESRTMIRHSYDAVITAPACTVQGYTTYTCSCGESYVDAYTDAMGHDYTDGVCTRCGMRETSVFQILDTRRDQMEMFTYEIGMTWNEWLNSPYNNGMGSCIAIWVNADHNLLGRNPYMDICVNGSPAEYDEAICEKDVLELVRYN